MQNKWNYTKISKRGNMSDKKILILDIDGTLVNSDKNYKCYKRIRVQKIWWLYFIYVLSESLNGGKIISY